MWTLRDARQNDLPQLLKLAHAAGPGLTTFPPDEKRLQQRLYASQTGEQPLFVLADPRDQPQGVSGLVRRVGDANHPDPHPFYAYRREQTLHVSQALQVRNHVEALHLVAEYDGPTEIGTLFLHPNARGQQLGRLLSLARFLFIANQPQHFQPSIIAELRGVVDDQGRSPFWDAIGHHFFQVPYADADARSNQDKQFIAELMPTHPIYVPLLPDSAKNVIGKVHPHTAPAQALLQAEGFYPTNLVDIFDAGPALRCDVQAIRTVRHSKVAAAHPNPQANHDTDDTQGNALVCRTQAPFIAVRCHTPSQNADPTRVELSPNAIRALQLETGDPVRVSPWR